MFKVKATVVDFLGDEEKYPCHFGHKIGDEIIFDGEKYIGRLCSDVWPILTPKVFALWVAGPRYREPIYYCPFWYAPTSVKDPSKKKYDGLGYKNVLKTIQEPQYHRSNLIPTNAFKWPPHNERTVAMDVTVLCPDTRTSVLFKLDAIDLADKGYTNPFFRRQMAILKKVLAKPGTKVDKILNEFSKEEIEGIYPALSQVMVQALVEELELIGYLEIQNGKASVTKKGGVKFEDFKAGLSSEEREALGV
jgi:uncharacterized repeat protein (TIGR04076 family)